VVARERGGRRETEGRARSSQYLAYFAVDGLTCCSTSAVNSRGSAQNFEGKRWGNQIGGCGLEWEGFKKGGCVTSGSNLWRLPFTEREGEKSVEKTMPIGGSHQAARDRGGRVGWFFPGWLGWIGPRAWPRWAVASFLLLFVLYSFSFVFCFSDLGFELANLV
jgi:hypothetical protein